MFKLDWIGVGVESGLGSFIVSRPLSVWLPDAADASLEEEDGNGTAAEISGEDNERSISIGSSSEDSEDEEGMYCAGVRSALSEWVSIGMLLLSTVGEASGVS